MNPVVKIVEPSGILDGTKNEEFRENIKKVVDEKPEIILIDFKDISFMDSSGLGALVQSLKTVRAAGLKLYICSINEPIKILFELTSMDQVFEIFANREEFEQKILANEK